MNVNDQLNPKAEAVQIYFLNSQSWQTAAVSGIDLRAVEAKIACALTFAMEGVIVILSVVFVVGQVAGLQCRR